MLKGKTVTILTGPYAGRRGVVTAEATIHFGKEINAVRVRVGPAGALILKRENVAVIDEVEQQNNERFVEVQKGAKEHD
ncbi:MAG: KOW motif-containing protein [Carboxydocellales bacterium]